MSALLRYLLILLGIVFLVRWVMRALFGASIQRGKRPSPTGKQAQREISGRTVKDPQCGTHVATGLAIPARVGGHQYHFCSKDCRDAFVAAQLK